jgi:hypothetical protein
MAAATARKVEDDTTGEAHGEAVHRAKCMAQVDRENTGAEAREKSKGVRDEDCGKVSTR